MRRTDGSDGGSAFPELRSFNADWANDPGMSLRDYFAGQALAGMMADHESKTEQAAHGRDHEMLLVEVIAKAAYSMADAMIAEREK